MQHVIQVLDKATQLDLRTKASHYISIVDMPNIPDIDNALYALGYDNLEYSNKYGILTMYIKSV